MYSQIYTENNSYLFNTTNFNNQHELITNNNYSSSDWQISIPFNTNNESMLASCYTNNHDINSYNCENSEYWICVKCQATATSYSDLSVTVRDEHTHLPDKTDKEILEIRQNLKRKAIDESVPIDRIVEEAFHVINNQFRSNDLLINIPSIHTIKNTVRKQRRKTRPPLPRSIEQLPFLLSDVYCKTTQDERFLLYVGPLSGVRSLVFSAYNDMIYLSQQENCLYRKFVDLGLKTAYKNDENLRDWFRSFAACSLLPLNHMLWGLQY
ncbi:unnamed protein product, partial [Rotaria sordida]